MSAPVTLYSPDGKRTREIAAIDAPGWIQAGWSTMPVAIPPIVSPIEEPAAPDSHPLRGTPPVVETQQPKARRNDVSRNAVSEN